MSRPARGVAAMLESFRGGGERVSGGRFRIDSSRAIAKLRDFRLADPHHYVLELLRAAVASGAKRVDVRVDADELELSFDGRSFPAAALRELFGYALSGSGQGDVRRLRLLAFGLLGALALKPRRLELRAGGLVLRIGRDGRIDVEPGQGRGTTIYVRKPAGLRVVRNLVAGAPERHLLETRTPQLPLKLSINGVAFTPDVEPDDLLARRESRKQGRHVLAVVPRFEPAPAPLVSLLHVSVHGVLVATHRLECAPLPVSFWVNDDRIQRNASGSDVVLDDRAYRDVVKELGLLGEDMLSNLVERLDGADAEVLRPRLTACAGILNHEACAKELSHRARRLLEMAPLLPGPSGEWVSIGELRRELRRRHGGAVRTADRKYAPELYRPPVVLLPLDPLQRLLLPKGRRQDVGAEVLARVRRERNKATWASQPTETPRLPDDLPWLCRAAIQAEGFEGEVGFLPQPAHGGAADASTAPTAPSVRFVLEGRLLEQRSVDELQPLKLTAVVQGGFGADAAWEGVAEDAAYRRALDAIREAAEPALGAAVADAAKAAADAAKASASGADGADGADAANALRAHARDLIAALVAREAPLPSALRVLPAYRLAGGGFISVAALSERERVRMLHVPWPHPAFDGEPVVVLGARDRDALRRLLPPGALEDVFEMLRAERAVRERLRGPREQPQLGRPVVALVPIDAPGVRGELALDEGAGLDPQGPPTLEVSLLREGFRLGTERWAALYGPCRAVAESAALVPLGTWDGAEHDAAWQRLESAVREAERRLPEALLKIAAGSLRSWPMNARARAERACWTRFFQREAVHGGWKRETGVMGKVAGAQLFEGVHRLLSLREIAEAAERTGSLFYLPPHAGRPLVPRELSVVVADDEVAHLLAEVTGKPLEFPWAEIERIQARRAFERLPKHRAGVPAEATLRAQVSTPHFRGEVVSLPGEEGGADVGILYLERLLCRLDLAAPLRLQATLAVDHPAVDPADMALPQQVRDELKGVLEEAMLKLVALAIERYGDPGAAAAEREQAHSLLLGAVVARLDDTVAALRSCPVFPTTDGGALTLAQLLGRKRVHYVTRSPGGAGNRHTVLAEAPAVLAALVKRLGRRRRDVTKQALARVEARQAHEERPVREAPRLTGDVWRRRTFEDDEIEGEVGLVPGEGRFLMVFHEQRLLCRDTLPGPPGFAAAVGSPRLEPRRDFTGVRHDRGFAVVEERVLEEVARLVAQLAGEWSGLATDERQRLAPILGSALAWLLSRRPPDDPSFGVPVLETTDDRPLSFRDLLAENAKHGDVLVASRPGTPLEAGRWIWRARAAERKALPKRLLSLTDATPLLARAEEVRAQPRVADLSVPGGRWPVPVAGEGIEGEAALPPGPSGQLTIELHVGRRLVERLTAKHPIGGLARVDGAALRPDAQWHHVDRDAAFHAVRAAVDVALERCQLQLLERGGRPDWEPFLDALLAQNLAPTDERARALAAIPAFESVTGAPVTLGQVRAAGSGSGRVAIVERAWARWAATHAPELLEDLMARGGVLLRVGPRERERLAALRVPFQDHTATAQREAQRARRRREQRLGERRHRGSALVRLGVQAQGWRGELALPMPFGAPEGIVLARDGVAVDRHHEPGLSVAGVLEHPALDVDADWLEARLGASDHAFIRDQIEALLLLLAEHAVELPPSSRVVAARYALAAAAREGVTDPAHLERLQGATAALARVPVLPTADGRWIDLRSVAAYLARQQRCSVVPDAMRPGESGEELVLLAEPNAPWLDDLASLLGRASLERLPSVAEWRRRRAEREPEPEDPLAAGLGILRREAALLRTVGGLAEAELKDLRLSRGDGATPIRYDAARGLGLLDPADRTIRGVLEQASQRPQAIYILLAAVYGAVNRALQRVTDEHEEAMAAALLEHLAGNPGLLDPPG